MKSVKDLLREARQYGLNGQYEQALPLNQIARVQSESDEERILSLRWEGVCLYYLERLEESERCLREAHELAETGGYLGLKLYLDNHLGATLRRLGRLDEALEFFTSGLAEARGKALISQRCRILGNLGALWDELGQRERAGDAYARYCELARLLADDNDGGNLARLANALGLAGRGARLRGDLEAAEQLGVEAGKLIERHGIAERRMGHFKYRGEQRVAQARALRGEAGRGESEEGRAAIKRLLEEAVEYFEAAHGALSTMSRGSREGSLLRGWALCDLMRGEAALAHQRARGAWDIAEGLGRREEKASAAQCLAKIAQETGLLGEAMFYLEEAIATRQKSYDELESPKVQDLARRRLLSIRDLTLELVATAQRVDLSDEERGNIVGLLSQVGATEGQLVADQPAMEWARRVREESLGRWTLLLGGETFDKLSAVTKRDLIYSDVVYHGVIDDLERCVHLFVVVVERELRERFIDPIVREALSAKWKDERFAKGFVDRFGRPSLGLMLKELSELVFSTPETSSFKRHLQNALKPHSQLFEALKSAMNENTSPLKGKSFKIRELRNSMAHGKGRPIDRLMVDAVRRRLLLGQDAPLVGLLNASCKLRPTAQAWL